MDDARLAQLADDNLASSAGYLVERGLLPGSSVQRLGNVTVIDSGLADDTYNLIVGADEVSNERINDVIAAAHSTGRPFAWWVAPVPAQHDLPGQLAVAGLKPVETEHLMVAELDREWPEDHPDLEIRSVDSRETLADFAEVDAQLWDPPNENVRKFFELTAPALLSFAYPGELLVGYAGGKPVCCTELHYAAGIAGIYNVATIAGERRKGYARAIAGHALNLAAADGSPAAILQASAAGRPLYDSLGFRSIGEYREYSIAPG